MNEGDIVTVFSQYGEIVDCLLIRDKETGESKGYCFVAYEDQRSTNLAVDNFNGVEVTCPEPMPDVGVRPEAQGGPLQLPGAQGVCGPEEAGGGGQEGRRGRRGACAKTLHPFWSRRQRY